MLKFIKSHWLFLIILVLASVLRLTNISDYAEFLGDQGRDLIIIRDFLVNHNLFFIGPQTSIGNMYLGPYFYYLIAPALFISNYNPVGPAVFMALFGIATVALIYYVVNYIFHDKKAALIASFLYALSPAAIKYSTFSWNPNIMPFFALLFVYFIYTSLIEHKYLHLLWATIAFIFCFNSHFLALVLLPFAFIFWALDLYQNLKVKDTKSRNSLITFTALSACLFVISLTPLFLFDFKHQGQNINAFIHFFTYRETTVNLKFYKGLFQIIPVTGQIIADLLGLQVNPTAVGLATFTLVALSLFLLWRQSKKQSLFILAWPLIGFLGLSLYKQHLYTHYYGFLFPAPFIILGLLISLAFHKFKFLMPLAVCLLAIPLILSNPWRHPPQNQIAHAFNLSRSVLQNLNQTDGKYNVTLLASYNDYRALAARYFLINGKSDQLLSQEQYAQAQTLFVIQDDPNKWPNPLMSDVWEIKSFSPFFVEKQFQSIDGTPIFKLTKHAPTQ